MLKKVKPSTLQGGGDALIGGICSCSGCEYSHWGQFQTINARWPQSRKKDESSSSLPIAFSLSMTLIKFKLTFLVSFPQQEFSFCDDMDHVSFTAVSPGPNCLIGGFLQITVSLPAPFIHSTSNLFPWSSRRGPTKRINCRLTWKQMRFLASRIRGPQCSDSFVLPGKVYPLLQKMKIVSSGGIKITWLTSELGNGTSSILQEEFCLVFFSLPANDNLPKASLSSPRTPLALSTFQDSAEVSVVFTPWWFLFIYFLF